MPGDVTIDFGIDLGTTNSAIAVFTDGMAQIIKNADADTTPSCVSFSGTTEWVGTVAKQRGIDHPESTFVEFKRNIGTSTSWPLPDGRRVTPEELSSRVLRELRKAAYEYTGTDVTAAVITVPAAFDTAQLAATRRAGEIAGFAFVDALQEPIAAALAYGFDQTGDGTYIVFDLGGGTFDSALLRCDGGAFSVMNHRGDNDLGGGRWDSYIVEQILLPKLDALGCDVSDGRDRSSRTFRLLKSSAEIAKIDLSRKDVAQFVFAGITDRRGDPLPDGVTIARDEYEALIRNDLQRAVGFCKDLLVESRLPASSVSKVILVGGPTRTPALRTAVQSLGIELASMVDPMTVVARGAAIYAAGRTRPVAVAGAPASSVVFQLHYEAMVENDRDEVIVGFRLKRSPEGSAVESIRVIAEDGSWDSGDVRLEDGQAVIASRLIAAGETTFRLSATGQNGVRFSTTPERFSITRGVAAAAAPVNHSIKLGSDRIEAGGGIPEAETIEIVPRGASMPVFKRVKVRTTREISPQSASDPIRLQFLEGESDVPERNLQVGMIEITPDRITRPLPANSGIEIVVRWDQGQDPKASAYIEFLDQDFSEVLTMRNKQLPDVEELQRQVDEMRERIGDDLPSSDLRAQALHELDVRLIDAREGDSAAAHSAQAQIGPLLDQLEKDSEHELLVSARAQVESAIAWARPLMEQYGTAAERQQFEQAVTTARDAGDRSSHRDLDARTRAIHEMGWRLITRQPGFWIEEFASYADRAAESSDPVRAGGLVARGRTALDQQDLPTLEQVTRELWALFPETSGSPRSYGIRAVG